MHNKRAIILNRTVALFLSMPEEFDKCIKDGGRVRRFSGPNKEHGLKKGEYVNICFKDGKAHRGEVKQKVSHYSKERIEDGT